MRGIHMTHSTCLEQLHQITNGFRIIISEDLLECIDQTYLNKYSKRIDWVEFSHKFMNRYPDKLEIIRPYIIWKTVSYRQDLSPTFINQFQECLDFRFLNLKVINNDLINQYGQRMSPETISKYEELSIDNIIKYANHLDWKTLIERMLLPTDLIYRFKKEIYLASYPWKSKSYNETIINRFILKFNWETQAKIQTPSCKSVDDYIELNKSDSVNWQMISDYTNLEPWFIMKYHTKLNYFNKDKEPILTRILRNNNLNRKERRSKEFSNWLKENNYIK
jgi:hypothetical protein